MYRKAFAGKYTVGVNIISMHTNKVFLNILVTCTDAVQNNSSQNLSNRKIHSRRNYQYAQKYHYQTFQILNNC
jgi:hypothetical protein